MDPRFWHEKWAMGQLGFHQEKVNSRLVRHWAELGLTDSDRVLVPLCGKTLDLLWLHEQGHEVLGVELSETACRDFFRENDLSVREQQGERFLSFSGAGITLWCGDFFALDQDDMTAVRGVYDRASLIALPKDLRKRYASHLGALLEPGARILLISMDYDESEMNGPPFSVAEEEVRRLFEDRFSVDIIARSSGPEIVGNLAARGLTSLNEKVYLLIRK